MLRKTCEPANKELADYALDRCKVRHIRVWRNFKSVLAEPGELGEPRELAEPREADHLPTDHAGTVNE